MTKPEMVEHSRSVDDRPRLPPLAVRPLAVVSAVLAVVLAPLSGRYGFHRDELYFLAAGDRIDWGYVDQPPLTPLLSRLSVELFGASPAGLRVVSMVACLAVVLVVALIARELGGGRWPQLLAACCAAVSGYVVAVGHIVSTSTFDLLAWLLITLTVLRLLRTGNVRWWPVIGALVGIAVQNKYLVTLLVVALLAALVVTGPRQALFSSWLAVGCAAAMVIAGPNLLWQAAHDWPQWTVARGISSDDGVENRIMFVPEQIVYLSPLLVPVWIAGWWRLWRDPAIRWARSMALAYPLLCGLVLASGGKGYYAVSLLLVLTAAGCAPTLAWLRRGRIVWRRGLLGAALATSAVATALISLPVLPPSQVSVVAAANAEQAEQIGWETLVSTVADGWSTIPVEERAQAVIFAQNYGQAGAIEHYGPDYGLVAPYSGHMSYADWGPPPDTATGPVLLVHQDGGAAMRRYFNDCQDVARVDNDYDLDNEEQGAAIVVCAGTTQAWSDLWPQLRRYY